MLEVEPYCKIHNIKISFCRIESGIEIYHCKECNKEYSEYSDISPIYWLIIKAKCQICNKEFYLSHPKPIEEIEKEEVFFCQSCNQMKERASDPKLKLDCYMFLAKRWSIILHLFKKEVSPHKIYSHISEYWQFCEYVFHSNYDSNNKSEIPRCSLCSIDKEICGTHHLSKWDGKVRYFQYITKISKKDFYSPIYDYKNEITEIIELILKNISKIISEHHFSVDKNDQQFLESLYKEIKGSE